MIAQLFAGSARLLRLPLTLLLCAALIAPSGCANMGDDDPNDVCRPERVALRSTGNYFAKDIITGAAIGAIAGGLIGLAAGGNARSALIGAAAGGALGAIGGYWRARQRQYQNQAQLYSAVYTDLDNENQSIDKTQLAFNNLIACRNAEAARIRADYRSGHLTREQAAAAMATVRAQSDSDFRLAQSINANIQHRGQDFTYASQQVAEQSGGYAGGTTRRTTAVRRPRTAPASTQTGSAGEVQTASTTNALKRDEFQRSITQAQNNSSRFDLSSS